VRWIFPVFAIGDRAIGVPVLATLYSQLRDKPVQQDLVALWSQLGVQASGPNQVTDDDHAPLVEIGKGIFARKTTCIATK
jgi:hypothetical protein